MNNAENGRPMRGSKKKVLVTGGAGYIGSVVGAHLLRAGYEVTALDDLSNGYEEAVPDGAEFVHGRIQDVRHVLDSSFGAVLHFAAFAEVGESGRRPEKYWHNNVAGSLALIDAMREANVRTLVFSSTCAVYGEPASLPITEDTRTAPINPYGASKLAVDHMIASECGAHGLAAVSLRYFNVAGAFERYGERHSPESHLIPLILQVAQGNRDSILVYGDDYPTPDGTCVRDYIHVADLAEAHLSALGAAEAGRHLICNLGNGRGYSVREVIEAARTVTGRPIPMIITHRRSGDPAVLIASADRARHELGWEPRRSDLTGMMADAWRFVQDVAGPTTPPISADPTRTTT
ncbi:UDP-glucose 4-epimerase GalE [Streptomyces sp. NPDC059786]|uniref:UDP-glucose 4-epimerase GalE n=1 Tax=Streptomyces sp. NPDC059786 TaxID=3346946 RepID=UPI00366A4670